MMLLIWYPFDHAGKSNGISSDLERAGGMKVPTLFFEFAGRSLC
jgi:hypothetical protein